MAAGDAAAKPPPAPAPAPEAAAAARSAWSTVAAAAAARAEGATARGCLPPGAPRAASVARYVHRLDSVLGRRVADVAADPTAGAPSALAALAETAAARATQLKTDASPKSRPRKKKALLELFAALRDAGCESSRAAVPRGDREPAAWFAAPPPGATPALLAGAPNDALAPGTPAWLDRGDAYYWRALARVQKLGAAAVTPHADLSPREAACARSLAEHALHLVRRGRTALAAADRGATLLAAGASAVDGWAGGTPRVPQAAARAALAAARARVPAAASRLADAAALVSAAADAERCVSEASLLRGAVDVLARCADRARAAAARLAADTRHTALVVSPAAAAAAMAALTVIQDVHATALAAAHAGGYEGRVPGWHAAVEEMGAGAAAATAAAAAAATAAAVRPPSTPTPAAADAASHLATHADAAVGALLAWAQALGGTDCDGNDAPPSLLSIVADAEARLRPRALTAAAEAMDTLVETVAAVMDGGTQEQGKRKKGGAGAKPRRGVMAYKNHSNLADVRAALTTAHSYHGTKKRI